MTDASDWSLLRKGLWPLSALYGLAVAIRNLTFDLGLLRGRLLRSQLFGHLLCLSEE